MTEVNLTLKVVPQVNRIEINSGQQPYVVSVYWQLQYFNSDGSLFSAVNQPPIVKVMDAETLGSNPELQDLMMKVSQTAIAWMNEVPNNG